MHRKFLGLIFLVALGFAVLIGLEGQRTVAEESTPVYPQCDLSVSFNLKHNLIRGDARITLHGAAEISLEGLRITHIIFNGKPFTSGSSLGLLAHGLLRINKKGLLEIRYEKIVAGAFEPNPLSQSAVVVSMINDKGIYLTGSWYPRVGDLAIYRLKALVPDGFKAVSEADKITSVETSGGRLFSFEFPHPVQGIDLVAADYVLTKASFGGVEIFTYFFPKDKDLAGEYIEYTKKYLEMDDKQLVPYAYKRYYVVENISPTGLSMPTFTLLGAEILRLPFVLKESLGHEITHQWFGDYVYGDFETGNWLEAITVYMSDYRYARLVGKGRQYRERTLVDYQSYVNSGNDFPLRKFFQRTGRPSEAIGYGKGMMLFNMLENIVGRDVFYKSLKVLIKENEWKVAAWDDIERVFEKESGRRLDWFFSQWLDRKGVPDLKIKRARFVVVNGRPMVRLHISQKGRPYRLLLQAKIFAGKKEIKSASLWLDGPTQTFQWAVSEKPTSIVVDGDYEIMRSLSPDEFPPVISRLLGSRRRIVVYRAGQKSRYESLLRDLRQYGFALKKEKDVTDKDIRNSSVLVIGADSPVLKRLFGKVESPSAGFVLTVRDNPLNAGNVVAFVQAGSRKEVDLAAPKIFHYGRYSQVTFSAGKNTGKETSRSEDGIVSKF